MDLRAFKTTTVGAVKLGELVFFDSHWRIKVEIPNDGKYLLNLTGNPESPLHRVFDESTDRCTGLAEGFLWAPHGILDNNPQPSAAHLSAIVTEKGLVIAAFLPDINLFFSLAGNQERANARGSLVFRSWSIHVNRVGSDEAWPVVDVGPRGGSI